MASKTAGLSWLWPIVSALVLLAHGASPAAAASVSGGVRISIENEYEADLNFGVLGKGSRNGKDRAQGVLNRQGRDYVGTVDAIVESTQQLSGLTGNCGPARYEDSQKLRVKGRPATGFNTVVQSVSVTSGRPGSEYLVLEFVPETATTTQPPNRNPGEDTVVNCHTLIETEATITDRTTGWSDILFLPLNDSRWTMKDGGYVIALPDSGILEYTDTTVLAPSGSMSLGPFTARKSIWTIRVERMSSSATPPTPATPASPPGCVQYDPNNPANRAPSGPGGATPICPPPAPAPKAPSQD